MGKKREAKNEKYGFGGRKRLQKQNDASSAADMDTFKQGRYNDGFGGRWGNILSNYVCSYGGGGLPVAIA